jgi:Na+/H+ antiporter NhaD/arsenite permease-like protein
MIAVQGLAVLVFVIVFILIAVEAIHRTHAALAGAFIFVFIGAVTPDEILHFIDIEILAVILGLFLLVRGAERSGLFQYLAIKIMKGSKSPTAFAVILLTFTVILAVFVSNIGAMLVMASITITMARSLKIKPQTLLIFQAVVINVGGMTLWMGSIPNIIIGIEGGLSFMDFIVNVLPLGVILYAVTLVIFIRLFKKDFTPEPEAEFRDLEFDEWIERAIDVSGLQVTSLNLSSALAALVMLGTIVGFMTYESLNLTPSFVALAGGVFMMMIQTREPSVILKEIDWSTILFLGGLFIMINGLGKIGVIEVLSHRLSNLIGDAPLSASIILMWLSGLASSVVDNIPLSTSLAPIVKDLVLDESWSNLWWGLVIGANLGGNMTPIGSPSNIITIGVSEQEGYPISFNQFLKMGLGLTLLYFVISMVYIYIRYGVIAV